MKILDGIVIACVGIALFIGAAFVYPGSPEQLIVFREQGADSMFKRLLAFLLPGWFILFGIRFFIFQLLVKSDSQPKLLILVLSSLIYSLLPCLIGSYIFYYVS